MNAPGKTVVSLRDVGKTFENGTVALDRFNLAVGDGEFVSLLGPSGCGKSTALRLIAGLSAPSQGEVAGPSSAGKLGFVFQEPTLMPWADVAANVRLPLKLAGADNAHSHAAAAQALNRVGLAEFAHSLSARIIRRHAHAHIDCPRAGDRTGIAADGRAVRRARRDHPLQAQQ